MNAFASNTLQTHKPSSKSTECKLSFLTRAPHRQLTSRATPHTRARSLRHRPVLGGQPAKPARKPHFAHSPARTERRMHVRVVHHKRSKRADGVAHRLEVAAPGMLLHGLQRHCKHPAVPLLVVLYVRPARIMRGEAVQHQEAALKHTCVPRVRQHGAHDAASSSSPTRTSCAPPRSSASTATTASSRSCRSCATWATSEAASGARNCEGYVYK